MSTEGWQKPEVISDEQWEKLEEWEKAELARTSATNPPQIEEPTDWVRLEGVTDEDWERAKEIARIRAAEALQENTSGTSAEPPAEVRTMGWCWGGFTFIFVWAFANRAVGIGILCLIPLVYVVMAFYLGFRGHEVAWRKRRFDSFQQYKETMRVWDKWGLWWFVINWALVGLSIAVEVLS